MTHYEELLKRISPKLKGIVYRLGGGFAYFNADDLYQEAALDLWQKFQAGKLNDKTNSYILQGCYFHLKNFLRKAEEKVNLVSLDARLDEEGMKFEEKLCSENSESCFGELEAKSLIDHLQNNGLTQREKEVLSLLLEDLTVREIGDRLGISHVRVVKIKANIVSKSKKA